MVRKNMQICAEEVIPEFREADGKPDYLREERLMPYTRAEAAKRFGKPDHAAQSRITGLDELVDHRTSHVPEVIDRSKGKKIAAE